MAHDHRKLGIELNGRTWDLLDKGAARTPEEAAEMINAAHASLWHWMQPGAGGTGANHQRGEWMIARVYCELGLTEPALRHLLRTRELTQLHADILSDFDFAFDWALTARVYALVGTYDEAAAAHRLAREAGQALGDPEDRKIFFDQLDAEPWFGLVREGASSGSGGSS